MNSQRSDSFADDWQRKDLRGWVNDSAVEDSCDGQHARPLFCLNIVDDYHNLLTAEEKAAYKTILAERKIEIPRAQR